MKDKVSRKIGMLAQKVAKEIYARNNYRITGGSGFKWWDFLARRPGDDSTTVVQVKGTVTRYLDCYPIDYGYVESQLDKFIRGGQGFGEYHLIVVSFDKGSAHIFNHFQLQSFYYEAQYEARHYDHSGVIALPWARCVNAHILSPKVMAEARFILAAEDDPSHYTGDLFIDDDY